MTDPAAPRGAVRPKFSSPMINVYSRDLNRAAAFYAGLGFTETFRTPVDGEPVHVELKLDGFTLGIATLEAAREHHALDPRGEGRWIEIVVWTDDVDAAVSELSARGAPILSPAHDFLEGKLRAAWVSDPDGNPVQLVQRKG
jgi:catechol 2,3-dioxygenase-like lactoylglutathione lyase family enzyme